MSQLRRLHDAMLADFEAHPEENAAVLSEHRAAWGLEAVPTLGVPHLLPRAARPRIARASEIIGQAMEKIGIAYFETGRFADLIPINARVRELFALDPGYRGRQAVTRLDASCDPETGALSLLECQAGDPSGAGWTDAFIRGLLALPALAGLRERLWPDPLACSHAELLAACYRQFAERRGIEASLRSVVFACARDAFVRSDHETWAKLFVELGWDAVVVDPRELTYDGRGLYSGSRPVPLLYRDTIDEYVTDPFWEATAPLRRAAGDGRICIVNPFCSTFADFKALLEVLTSDEHVDLFTRDEQSVLRDTVPWTRVVTERYTTMAGHRIDLVPWVRAHQRELVLKPNDGYGGFGITIGCEVEVAAWEAALAEALEAPGTLVVQRFVELPRARFPVLGPQGLEGTSSQYITSSFWLHRGRFVGGFARVADRRVVNVHQGGGIVPTFFADLAPGR